MLVGAVAWALVGGVVGCDGALQQGGAASRKAAALFIAPNGSDASSCRSNRNPCLTFNRAYQLARPGEVVEVAGGVYAGQTIAARRARTAPNVVFRPAKGTRVVVGGLTFRGSDHVTVRGMSTTYHNLGANSRNQHGIFVGPGSTYVTLQGMDAGSVDSWQADHLTVSGGDYGPCNALAFNQSNVCGNNKQDVSSNVLITGATFHDLRMDGSCLRSGADCHWEGMYINGGRNVTVRNSRFHSNSLYNIFATISGPDAGRIGHKNLVIENNWFATPWRDDVNRPARPTGISLAWCQNSPHGYQDVLVRFNSFSPNTGVELDGNTSCVFRNVRVVGNLLQYPGNCASNVAYAFNVWTTTYRTGRCSATDRTGTRSLPYRRAIVGRGLDFRLVKSRRTLADDLVPTSAPGGCPGRDAEGHRRPLQKRCDAGADERVSPRRR
jgi:hypothetical protein